MSVQSTSDTSARQAAAVEDEIKRAQEKALEQARQEAADEARADAAAQADAADAARRSAEVPPSSKEEPTNKPHRDDIHLRDASVDLERGAGSVVDDVI